MFIAFKMISCGLLWTVLVKNPSYDVEFKVERCTGKITFEERSIELSCNKKDTLASAALLYDLSGPGRRHIATVKCEERSFMRMKTK